MSAMTVPTDAYLHQLAKQVGEVLLQTGQSLACAESCTGGYISKVITDVAGSSRWFERGFITYTNQSKTELLGVPADLIAREGAVCEATARAMAAGALLHSAAQNSLAVTGIAGPGGGRLDKPVGLVWFAWAGEAGKVDADHQHFPGDRDAVRRQAVAHALQGVLMRLD
jgi:nicotinamide-nucleotide amidase